jgi:hypothetical protein
LVETREVVAQIERRPPASVAVDGSHRECLGDKLKISFFLNITKDNLPLIGCFKRFPRPSRYPPGSIDFHQTKIYAYVENFELPRKSSDKPFLRLVLKQEFAKNFAPVPIFRRMDVTTSSLNPRNANAVTCIARERGFSSHNKTKNSNNNNNNNNNNNKQKPQ